jgi:hypothetical protein
MKDHVMRLVFLSLPLIGLAGCATTPYKPAGLTDQQVNQKLNDLRQVCWHLRQGAHVTISFYDGATTTEGKTVSTMTGYFYGFNKMNDMVAVSAQPLTVFDRGEPYDLRSISEITPMQDSAMNTEPSNVVLRAVQHYFTVDAHDAERALLTQ